MVGTNIVCQWNVKTDVVKWRTSAELYISVSDTQTPPRKENNYLVKKAGII